MQKGLSSSKAAEVLKAKGYNELPSARPKNILHIAAEVVREPMFILLLGCGLLYILLGSPREGITLLSSILLIISISFYQHRKTERALEALKKLSAPRVMVIRDGKYRRIPGREVVEGDFILLSEGDRVPADALLREAEHLSVDESLLTGESLPVSKIPGGEKAALMSGTLVVQGRGIAEVTATGANARLGKIASSIQTVKESETRFQKEMKTLIRRLSIIGVFISLSLVAVFYFTRGNFIRSLLNGLSASMAILPEEFPVVFTVFLALGAWRLSRKNVLTRKPSAIESLGSATVLCTDKTGTLTQNKMEIAGLYNGNGVFYSADFAGGINQAEQLLAAALNASPPGSADPMETAIQALYKKNHEALPVTEPVKTYPLSKDLLAMTRVTKDSSGKIFISAKGAPEAVFELCRLEEKSIALHAKALNDFAAKGYRMLGVAQVDSPEADIPSGQKDFSFRFLGLLAFEDPVRPEVPAAIQECREAGIRVIMITGDFPLTAKSIAEKCGLSSENILTGTEIDRLSDEALKNVMKRVSVCARVIPEQKLRIVEALKSAGEIVAMTGDGVNDAPALKAADIGVSMGNKGTDVAREASSLVLLDDNFASIVAGIRMGRRIFDNMQKAMSYILAIHIPIVGLALIPAFISNMPLILMPLHIVFMELIIDPVCSVAFEAEHEEKNVMKRPPRDVSEPFFGTGKILFSLFEGLLLLGFVCIVYFISVREGHTEGEVRAIAFSSLITGNLFLILTDISSSRSFLSVFTGKNFSAIIILVIATVLLFLCISVPGLTTLFKFEFPGYRHFIPALAGAGSMLLLLELIKLFKLRRK